MKFLLPVLIFFSVNAFASRVDCYFGNNPSSPTITYVGNFMIRDDMVIIQTAQGNVFAPRDKCIYIVDN